MTYRYSIEHHGASEKGPESSTVTVYDSESDDSTPIVKIGYHRLTFSSAKSIEYLETKVGDGEILRKILFKVLNMVGSPDGSYEISRKVCDVVGEETFAKCEPARLSDGSMIICIK